MAKSKIKFISPLDPKLKNPRQLLDQVPIAVVKGLIHGLLSHLWSSDRRQTKEIGVPQDRMERVLMELVRLASTTDAVSEDALLKTMKLMIPAAFEAYFGHTYLVMCADSDLILEGLEPYGRMNEHAKRLSWLQKEIPGFLATIKKFTQCTECRGKTSIPSEDILGEWAATAGIGELRNCILGHYHGLNPLTVKRHLSSRPKRLRPRS
jgi:hypothetical protein